MSAVADQGLASRVTTGTSSACATDVRSDDLDADLHCALTRTRRATYTIVLALSAGAVGAGMAGQLQMSLLACACALGWLNLSGGPCAQNALTAITPLAGGASTSKATWYKAALAYTIAGLVSSMTVGYLLGTVGMLAGFEEVSSPVGLALIGLVVSYSVLREGMGLSLPLPQAKRSSRSSFARLGQPTAAVLWGLDVGSFFSTWLTFAGAWWLVAVGVSSGSPLLAAAILGAHWLGRSALVWLGRWIIPDANEGHRLPAMWSRLHSLFRRLYVGIVLGATLLVAFS